jgi:peroxiredoxin
MNVPGLLSNLRAVASSSVLVVLLASSAALNVTLAQRLRTTNATVATLKNEGRVQIGADIPPITGKALDGTPIRMSYQDSNVPTILYVFTPSCSWCLRNVENIRQLTSQVTGRYRVIGLSLSREKLAEYVEQHQFPFPIVTDLSEETLTGLKAGGTPQTFVVGRDGKLIQSWRGAFQQALEEAIERELQVALPGLTPPAQTAPSGE